MTGCMGGCLGRFFALVLLAVVIAAAWRFGPELADRLGEDRAASPPAVSPETADQAMARYEALVRGEESRILLTAPELESLLRFRLAQEFPPGITDPSIRILGGEVRAGLRVALELLPTVPELEEVRGILPDTVPVEFRGILVTLEGGRPAFIARRIDAAGIPIPRRFHPAIVQAVDPVRGPDLPAEAIALPLPPGVRSVHAEEESLVVTGLR